jgi:hypothetical protein
MGVFHGEEARATGANLNNERKSEREKGKIEVRIDQGTLDEVAVSQDTESFVTLWLCVRGNGIRFSNS